MSVTTSLLNFALRPQMALFKAWKKMPVGSFKLRLDYDIMPRPNYGFCLYYAAQQAERLGIKKFSAMEFGVAGGNGLLELERLAEEIEKEFDVEIEIYGFDTGEGLPDPVDYRDLPYIWQGGFYKMDQAALKSKLKRSELVLGDVKDTVPVFIKRDDVAPLGAVFSDLDFWSSTIDALQIFDGEPSSRMPRAFCYFDDVNSSVEGGLLNDYVGQLRAIADYNESREHRKITPIAGFQYTRRIPSAWNNKIYVHHDFAHPDYDTYVHADRNRQLAI